MYLSWLVIFLNFSFFYGIFSRGFVGRGRNRNGKEGFNWLDKIYVKISVLLGYYVCVFIVVFIN